MIIKEKIFYPSDISPIESLRLFVESNSISRDRILSITYRTPNELCLFYDCEGLHIFDY